jgi:hypothetical protein
MESFMTTCININTLHLDGGTQTRAQLNQEIIDGYAEAMQEGAKFPPIDVFWDKAVHWVADGFHRVRAAIKNGFVDIDAEIHMGTVRDCVLYSVGTNSAHGLPRTPEDKKRAVLTLVNDKEWGLWSDREIARRCNVSHTFVAKYKHEGSSLDENPVRTCTTKHGTVAKMNTAGIGEANTARAARHEPTESPEPSRRLTENPNMPITDRDEAEPDARHEPTVIPDPPPPVKQKYTLERHVAKGAQMFRDWLHEAPGKDRAKLRNQLKIWSESLI